MHWLLVLLGLVLGLIIGVPIACALVGLATSAQSADLHRELWQCKIRLERLLVAVDGDDRTTRSAHAINKAVNEAREVLR